MSDNNLTHGREGTQRAQESNADTLLQEALELVELAQAKLSKVYWSGVRWCVVEPMAEANSRLGGACVSLKKAMRVNNWLRWKTQSLLS